MVARRRPALLFPLLVLTMLASATTWGTSASERAGAGVPLATVSGDFDGDGRPDVVAVYHHDGAGLVVVHEISKRRLDAGRREVLDVDADLVVAGDVDGNGVDDLILGSLGAGSLTVLHGSREGALAQRSLLALPGALTALGTTDVNRPDGLVDLIVGLDGPDGPGLAVFEGLAGALDAAPEWIALPSTARQLASGRFRGTPLTDIAVLGHDEIVLVAGRDRRLHTPGVSAEPPRIFSYRVEGATSLAAVRSLEPDGRTDLAVRTAGGRHIVLRAPAAADPAERWRILSEADLDAGDGATLQTMGGRYGSGPLLAGPDGSRAVALAAAPAGIDKASLPSASLVVTSTGDGPDVSPGDGLCDDGTGNCTFRAALEESNDLGGVDIITFALGAGTPSIAPSSPLPVITDAVSIEGDTGGATRIELNGSGVAGAAGLTLANGSSGSLVRGLVINRFADAGIRIESAGNVVENCWIGLDALGSISVSGNTGSGVVISGAAATDNLIGGTAVGTRNVISNNAPSGVRIEDGASDNRVQGNFIGTTAGANLAAGNAAAGVAIAGAATNNTIGGLTASPGTAPGNVISGNIGDGVDLSGPGTSGNLIVGNLVGLLGNGLSTLGNRGNGVTVQSDAAGNTIGGTTAMHRNVISGNSFAASDGIELAGAGVSDINVFGNTIGLDRNGSGPVSNAQHGLLIRLGAHDNTVGSATAMPGEAGGNVISGNLVDGIQLADAATEGNLIQGNLIGLQADGADAEANGRNGITIDHARQTTIGGAVADQRNVISGHASAGSRGIYVSFEGNDTVIQGNFIGTDRTGSSDLGNRFGIHIGSQNLGVLSGVVIGGATATPGSPPGNVISGNGEDGVLLQGVGIGVLLVQGNLVGLNAAGEAALPNARGLKLHQVSNVLVGGASSAVRNVISGNGTGVLIDSEGMGNRVEGNLIGTDPAGTAAIGNDLGVLTIRAIGDRIGGSTGVPGTPPGNVISGNTIGVASVYPLGPPAVVGNIIGATQDGLAALPNGTGVRNISGNGVFEIGGSNAGDRNLISGNTGAGVDCTDCGVSFVRGNWIGIDVTGMSPLPNGVGVLTSGSPQNGDTPHLDIGGPGLGAGNVISGNIGPGISFSEPDGSISNVQGNRIGTAPDGVTPLGNGGNGIEGRVNSGTIGGTTGLTPGACTGSCNVIRWNGGDGVTGTLRAIRGNRIADNADLGIDLYADGVTPNDSPDILPTNFPVVAAVIFNSGAGTSTIQGTLHSTASSTFDIEVFSSATADPSGYGEGEVLLGSTVCATDAAGNGTWSLVVNGNPPNVSATSTHTALLRTSEFALDFVDADADGFADGFDNCPVTSNTDQIDSDFDGTGDACDCAPDDPGSIAEPGEITGLHFGTDGVTLSWDSAVPTSGAETAYDVLIGSIADLPVNDSPTEACLATGLTEPSIVHGAEPPPGGQYYLVRAINACGAPGPWGTATDGTPRQSSVCP